MNAVIDEPLSELKAFIIELASDTYDREGKGLLLSRVGETIYKQRPHLREALGKRKLVEFIEKELVDSVCIHSSPENRIVKIILPASIVVADVKDFLPVRADTSSTSGIAPRYNRVFWAAFSHPLKEGCTRLVWFVPQVDYEDIEGEPPTETAKRILEKHFIVDTTTESNPARRIQRIKENIKQWLELQGLSIDIVLARPERERVSSSSEGAPKGTILELLLSALDDSELRRIQMPLDLVAKLSRRQ